MVCRIHRRWCVGEKTVGVGDGRSGGMMLGDDEERRGETARPWSEMASTTLAGLTTRWRWAKKGFDDSAYEENALGCAEAVDLLELLVDETLDGRN